MNNGDSTYSLICNKCKQIIWLTEFAKVADTCAKPKCWIKRPCAMEEAAKISNKHIDDFKSITKGSIIIHTEKEIRPKSNTHYPFVPYECY